MSENNLHKKYFTEQDSPVPLIPTDLAWQNMQEKLNSEQPRKRKRRLFFWIQPVGCATVALLLLAGGMLIWWAGGNNHHGNPKQTGIANDDRSFSENAPTSKTTVEQTITNKPTLNADEETSAASKPTLTAEPETDAASKRTLNTEQEASATSKPTLTAEEETSATSKPTLAAHDETGRLSNQANKYRPNASTRKKRTAAVPIENRKPEAVGERDLPFATPQLTTVASTMAIAVITERALPGIPFPENRSPDSNRNAAIVLSAGLQWQVPVPLSGFDHYAKGPNGKHQPYQLLIPGLWLGAAKNKHKLIAMIMPFTGTPLSNKYYEKGVARTSDSLMANKSMVKIFGLQAGLHYSYQADQHWCIGAGLDANWWNKGLVYAKPVDDSLGMGIKPFLYSVNSKTEKKLNPFQLSTVIEAGYRFKAWEGILQLSRPWNATLKGQSPPVWLRLVIRYRLLRKQSAR